MRIQKLHYAKLNQNQSIQNNNKQNSKTYNNVSSDVNFTRAIMPKKVFLWTATSAVFVGTFFLGKFFGDNANKDKIKTQTENIQQIQENAKNEFVDAHLNIDKKNLSEQLERDNKGINNAFKSMNMKTDLLKGESVYECFMNNEIKVPYNTSDKIVNSQIINDINRVKEQYKNANANEILGKEDLKMIPFSEAEGKKLAKLPKIIANVSLDNTGDSIVDVLGEKYKAIADKALKQAKNNPFVVKIQTQKMKNLKQVKHSKTFAIPKKIINIKYYIKNF